jgi:hypothetical protein
MNEHPNCPIDCPNRREKTLSKGYSYLFAVALTVLLGFQGLDGKVSSAHGIEIKTKEVPMLVLGGYIFLVAGALGFDTDSLAAAFGNALSAGRKLGS